MAIRVMSIFGTRPEAIKMLPLVRQIRQTDGLLGEVCVTAQHREMLDQAMDIFGITADYDLNIMKRQQTLTTITTDVMDGLAKIFAENRPDLVLVHGDTSTSFAAALSAFYHKITVGHVEAGLRTYHPYSPFPEELNRTLTSRLATLHFAPTIQNVQNLARENITEQVFLTGNTVIDALLHFVKDDYTFRDESLKQIDLTAKRTILVTAHRSENLGTPLRQMFTAVLRIAEEFPDTQIIFPVHRNPVVQTPAREILGNHPRIHLLNPIDAEDLHNLIARSYLVLTDSGGLQEEAPSLGKPVLVMRTETERPEAVAAGVVKLVGVETETIAAEARRLLTDDRCYNAMSKVANPYGDGRASQRICHEIVRYFREGNS